MSMFHRLAVLGWAVVALGGARTAAAKPAVEVCRFTTALAETLRQAHPEADLDGDGYLSRDEACEFQAEVRRRFGAEAQVSTLAEEDAAELDRVLSEPLCCNCDEGAGLSPSPGAVDASCQRTEGVD